MTQSAFVAKIKDAALQAEQRQALITEITKQCYSLDERTLPPLGLVHTIGSHDYAHFRNNMCGVFSELMRRFKLDTQSSILDLGSGCGRMAFPFSMLLTAGKYYGVDVWAEGIAWCQEHLTAANENLTFFCVPSRNNYYFDAYKEAIHNDYRLAPIADESIDLAFAISTFTHLIEKDCRDYFQEIHRVLRPGGAAYITGFVIDDFFFEYVERTGNHKAVTEKEPGWYQAYAGQDFFSGFAPEKWDEMLTTAGLRVVARDLGNWAEKPGALGYQDVFIVVKSR